jgi:hypothetical protein
MNNENVNKRTVSEPSTEYKTPKRSQGIGKDFDFEKEFAKGLTVEKAKAEMHRRISQWKWEK